MKDPFKSEGRWWLPKTPEARAVGTITFVPGDKLQLEIQGALDPDTPAGGVFFGFDFINPILVNGTIRGENRIAEDITLYKCRQIQRATSSAELVSESFIAEAAFVGAHFRQPEEIAFKSLSIHYANLEAWSNKSPISSTASDDGSRQGIQYVSPEPIFAYVNNTLLRIFFLGPATTMGRTRATLSYETRIEITPPEPQGLKEYLEWIRRTQDFLSLSMGGPTFPTKVAGQSEANKRILEGGREYFQPIDIYYLVPWWPDDLKQTPFSDMLFPLPSIEETFGMHLQKWFEAYELLKPAINLYFSVLYNPNSYGEVKFLSLAQAIETYHRRVMGGKYEEDAEYRTGLYEHLVKAIPDALDRDFKTSLTNRILYGNEYSFRKRLRDTAAATADVLDLQFISTANQREAFVSKATNTRNYLTHYSPELADGAARSGEELRILTTQLQVMLEVCFLQKLGFEDAALRQLIRRSHRYKFLRSRQA